MPPANPTTAELIREARRLLANEGIDSPDLDAEVLLRDILQLSREEFFLRMTEQVPQNAVSTFRSRVQQRLQGTPIAYIVGKREFYGREFVVSPSVLVPRPETEYLVDLALRWLRKSGDRRQVVADVGTGSGAIAVSIAMETAGQHHVIASDISSAALAVARTNRDAHRTDVDFVAGSLLDWCRVPIGLIVANLPYLRPDQAHDGISHEPAIALFAGEDGFALNRELICQAEPRLKSPGMLIMEIDPGQAAHALALGEETFPNATVGIKADLATLDRYLIIERI